MSTESENIIDRYDRFQKALNSTNITDFKTMSMLFRILEERQELLKNAAQVTNLDMKLINELLDKYKNQIIQLLAL